MNQQLRAVSRLWLLFAAFIFAQGVSAQVSITSGVLSYTQNFNTLVATGSAAWSDNTTLPNWYASINTGTPPPTITAGTGSSNAGAFNSFGTGTNTDRTLGSTASGGAFFGSPATGAIALQYGVLLKNNAGTAITSLSVTYTGEQWRNGGNTSSQPLTVDYTTGTSLSVSTGTYTSVPALTFNTPINTATAAALDGNASANRTTLTTTITFSTPLADGQQVLLRWTDINDAGNDHGLGIDDLTITATLAGPPAATFTVSPTTLTGYVATQGTASPAQSYTITGSNLNGNPVSVSATSGIELSTTMGGTYTPTLSIPATTSAVSQEIFARLTNTAPTGVFSGTITNTANTTLTATVMVSGTVNAPNAPTLSASPTTLSGFSTPQGTPSAEQSYTLTAANLTAAISVSAPAGVEVSPTTGSGFGSSFTLPMSTTSAAVYVRLNSAAATTISGTITNVSGSQTANVAVTGTVSSTAPVSYTLISQIQGSGATAALTGTQTIEGIVTRTFATTVTGLGGFFLQEEDADSDGNSLTSEGIFVFDPSGFYTGNPGDKVRLTGVVTEYTSTANGNNSSLTEITLTSAANFMVVSTGNPLPTIPSVQLPVTDVTDLERYEGMLVTMSAATGNLTVTEYFQLGRYGQVVLSATDAATDQPGTDPRLDQYTQFFAPSVSGYTTYLANIAKRRIYLDDGNGSQNTDPIIFGRGGQPLSATNTLRGGDQVTSITAVLDERFEGYRLQTKNGADANFQTTNPRPATPPAVGGTLRVGNFNLLNYFNDLGTSNFTNCSGTAIGRRGANNATEFTRQRDKIINAIINSGSDVLGLNEVENNGFGSNSAIQDLVNGLNAVAGANSFTYINSGCISTDAITVAMVYKPALVTPVGASAAIPFNYGTGAFTDVGRRSLAQTFQQNSNGAVFTLVSNHWKSKGSSAGGTGDADAGDGQSASNGTRTRQAQDVVSWLATNPTGTTDPDYLVVGDLNAYAKEDPLTTLETGGYTNLVPNTTYSYVFDGFVGALDHALRSSSLAGQIVGADKWHINSDEPSVLDYNTEFKTAGQITSLYSPEPYRASDHDPVLIGLNLTAPVVVTPLALTFTASPNMLTTAGSTTLTAMVSGGTTPYSYTFSGPGTITPSGNTAMVSGLMAGVQTFTVVARDATSPTSQTISGTVSVTVSAANTPPVATANANQTATVGVAFSYTVNAFTDAESPNSLTYSASISPANGFSFDPATRVISGTPSMSGVSSVTVTATDPGSLSASTTFTITVSPAPVAGNAQLSVLHQDVSFGQTTTNTILPYLQLVNSGAAPIAYSAITVRYWLTVEGNSPITNFQNYYVQIGGNNVHEQYVPLATPRQGATAYVEYSFDAAAGSLAGGTNSGPIQNGFSKADYSAFNQSDDYSYVANRDYVANARITAYVNGVLVYGQEPPGMGSVTPLALTLTASPTMLTTSGTTSLSATVSGGTTPYSYTFTGPGTITPSGNTANVSAIPAGVQTYTVVARDATSPTSQTISGTVSVTVTQANTAPVATANANQTATVGTAFSYTVNAFTDNETPNQLTYSASINPANGFSFDPATRIISGTPSMSGVSSVTVTATDPGSLSASTTFTITVSPAPVAGNAQLSVLHQDVSFGQTTTNTILPYLQLVNSGAAPIAYSAITVRYWLTVEGNSPITNFQNYYVQIGGNNVHEQYVPLATPRQGATAYVEYSFDAAAGSLAGGTNSGPIQNGFSKADYSAFNQSDDYSYVANRDYVANARITAYVNGVLVYGQEPLVGVRVGAIGTEVPLGVQVLGNPVHEMLNVEVTGASGSSLHLTLTDGQGRIVGQQAIEQASTSERVHFKVGQQPSGVLMLRATTPTQSQTVKVIKTE